MFQCPHCGSRRFRLHYTYAPTVIDLETRRVEGEIESVELDSVSCDGCDFVLPQEDADQVYVEGRELGMNI